MQAGVEGGIPAGGPIVPRQRSCPEVIDWERSDCAAAHVASLVLVAVSHSVRLAGSPDANATAAPWGSILSRSASISRNCARASSGPRCGL